MTADDIRHMSEDDLLDMDYFLNEDDEFGEDFPGAARNGRSISVYADPVSDRHHQRIIKRICDDILNDLYTNSYKSLKMYNHAVHDEKIEYFHIRSFFL